MSDTPETLKVRILNSEYNIQCPPDQRQDLMTSADYLNTHMQKIKDDGKTLEFDKIAVISALNITFDLLQYKRQDEDGDSTHHYGQLKRLHNKVDNALNRLLQLEI